MEGNQCGLGGCVVAQMGCAEMGEHRRYGDKGAAAGAGEERGKKE